MNKFDHPFQIILRCSAVQFSLNFHVFLEANLEMAGDQRSHKNNAQAVNQKGREGNIQIVSDNSLCNSLFQRGLKPFRRKLLPLPAIPIGKALRNRRNRGIL